MLGQKGAGIIEVLISMLIIAIAGLGTIYLLSMSHREQAFIIHHTQARDFAQEFFNRYKINASIENTSLYNIEGNKEYPLQDCQKQILRCD